MRMQKPPRISFRRPAPELRVPFLSPLLIDLPEILVTEMWMDCVKANRMQKVPVLIKLKKKKKLLGLARSLLPVRNCKDVSRERLMN